MTSQAARNRLCKRLVAQGITHPQVLDSIASVPRHLFVDEALASRAYENCALPIGHRQTISQPYIVALMTESLMIHGVPKKVLEIGTGSGYQAAILSHFVEQVFSLERIDALLRQARRVFRQLKISNIRTQFTDGSKGWPSEAPYDAILLTSAPEQIPEYLFQQLAVGGVLIAPVGPKSGQSLLRLTKTSDDFQTEILEQVSFVPMLTGKQ